MKVLGDFSLHLVGAHVEFRRNPVVPGPADGFHFLHGAVEPASLQEIKRDGDGDEHDQGRRGGRRIFMNAE
jgi:hypothetical protein